MPNLNAAVGAAVARVKTLQLELNSDPLYPGALVLVLGSHQ